MTKTQFLLSTSFQSGKWNQKSAKCQLRLSYGNASEGTEGESGTVHREVMSEHFKDKKEFARQWGGHSRQRTLQVQRLGRRRAPQLAGDWAGKGTHVT